MKYIRILAVLLVMCMLFAGCKKNTNSKPQFSQIPSSQISIAPAEVTFTHHGISMTLPSYFSDNSQTPIGHNYGFLYGSHMLIICGEFFSKDTVGENITSFELFIADYANQFNTEAVQKDGFWTVQYEDPSQNEPQIYVCAFYETEDTYWVISSYCPAQIFDSYSQDMWQYVTSAVFE